MLRRNKKVILAMSGGVDSSVAAVLLKRAGFNVIGVFMRLHDSVKFKEGEKRARKVAKKLEIPFLVLDLRKRFKKEIINYFLEEYRKGRTPNPCVLCNKEIKFDTLLEKAFKMKADLVATGHYARKVKRNNAYKLFKAEDKAKDQSYFLWKLGQKQLKSILFPNSSYSKEEIKKLAKRYKLPVINISESQEVCFIEKTTEDFLASHLKLKPGKIIDTKGKIVGKHQGVHFYTIGQRKGIRLSGGPWYVLDKNLGNNTLIITKNEKDLEKKELIAGNINWISGKAPKLPLEIKVKIRYRTPLVSAKIIKKSNNYKVIFSKPQRAITPGQSVVFYKGEELLGGGIIK